MNLHSDYPYWLVNEGVLTDYPRLQGDTETGALIIGGGISGALIGHELAKRDIASIIVDKRHIGFGSTSSSTALLQYEIDNPLHRLSGQIGEGPSRVRDDFPWTDAPITVRRLESRL